ncbi:MAG TPA: hypothetical protein VK673_03840 [Chthoniobacterales bacterium]|nr:hypothetical protein [Chthoniobacterales bacterium]
MSFVYQSRICTRTAVVAGPVDPAAAADRVVVVDRAAAVDTEVPELQWAAAQPDPGRSGAGACPATVRPTVGPGTAVPDTALVTLPPQPAFTEQLSHITPPRLRQKTR